MKIKSTSIIRDRGQLTLPEKIRETFRWARPSSVVIISTEKPDEIIIRPYTAVQTSNWKVLWKKIATSRSIKGKTGNLSAFISRDRGLH